MTKQLFEGDEVRLPHCERPEAVEGQLVGEQQAPVAFDRGRLDEPDPKLTAPGTGISGGAAGPAFGSLDGYKLGAGSPAINAGASIAGNGGLDFWGEAIVGMPDIGAYEAR